MQTATTLACHFQLNRERVKQPYKFESEFREYSSLSHRAQGSFGQFHICFSLVVDVANSKRIASTGVARLSWIASML
jgi:hypothetical protein